MAFRPYSVATAALSLLTPVTVAFIGPTRVLPSPALHLYQEDGATYPSGGKKSPLVNATFNGMSPTNGDSSSSNNIAADDDEMDVVGAGTLGDIMAGSGSRDDITKSFYPSPTTVIDGLVTKEGGELNARFGCNFTPMERIALTANGNLQRIFSSYYDSPVHVHVDSCSRRENNSISSMNGDVPSINGFNPKMQRPDVTINGDAIWDRVVHIQVHDRTICKATSIISVQCPLCISLIEDGSVGLGQMFRYLNKLPTFSLLDAGRKELEESSGEFRGEMWRTYELQSEEMTCLIHEEFHSDAWNII